MVWTKDFRTDANDSRVYIVFRIGTVSGADIEEESDIDGVGIDHGGPSSGHSLRREVRRVQPDKCYDIGPKRSKQGNLNQK